MKRTIAAAETVLDQAVALGVREGVLQRAALFRARGDAAGYFRSIREASQLGILPARYQLALCYQNGDGVAQNTDRALEIMYVAAERGHLGAKIFIARRLLSNPLRPARFLMGVLLLISASVKSLYLVFRDPDSDLLR